MAKPPVDSSFTDDVARFYESTLVPLIFEPYASDLATRAAALAPSDLLEVACGTGVATRALVSAMGAGCAITATDLNEAMVAHGASIGSARPVSWRTADVMALPFPEAAFDVVVCQFGVMFFPDRVAAYREVRRVLRPDGTFLFNVWNEISANELADEVTRAVAGLFPDDPPRFLARTPHGHGSPAEIEDDLARAGFTSWEIDQRDDISPASGPEIPAIAYCQGTPLRNEIEARDPAGLERATAAATEAVRARWGDGPIEARISGAVVTARQRVRFRPAEPPW